MALQEKFSMIVLDFRVFVLKGDQEVEEKLYSPFVFSWFHISLEQKKVRLSFFCGCFSFDKKNDLFSIEVKHQFSKDRKLNLFFLLIPIVKETFLFPYFHNFLFNST